MKTPRERATVVVRFVRGTLECDGIPVPTTLPMECPLVFDTRTQRFRGRAVDRPDVHRSLCDAGFDVVDVVDGAAPSLPFDGARAVPLRDYQGAALTAWCVGDRRGIIVLPTGAGKTRVAIAALAAHRAATLIIVPTRVLLRQWRADVRRFYTGPVGLLGDGVRDLRGVTVATFASARRWMPQIGDHFGLVVVDEAHHFGGAGWGEVLEMCAAPARLGLTATPPRGLELMRLVHLIGPIRFEIHTTKLAGTHLASVQVVQMLLDLSLAERREYERARATFAPVWSRFAGSTIGAPWNEFVQYCRQSTEGREALRAWHQARRVASWTSAKSAIVADLLAQHRCDRVLVFTADKESSYDIARRQLIMPITSDVSRAERQWAIDAFRRGDLHALVSARVLNEGVDVPGANVCILVGGTHGEREFVQRVGRVLRPQPGKRALVYELTSSNTTEEGQSFRRRGALGST